MVLIGPMDSSAVLTLRKSISTLGREIPIRSKQIVRHNLIAFGLFAETVNRFYRAIARQPARRLINVGTRKSGVRSLGFQMCRRAKH